MRKICIFVVLVLFLSAGVLLAQLAGRLPVKGVRFPVEYYADGTVKMELYAHTAFVDADNQNVDAEGIRVFLFNPQGEKDGIIMATNCFYSKETNLLTSADEIYFQRAGTTVTGTGYELDVTSNKFKILNDVKMIVDDVEKLKETKIPKLKKIL